MLNKLFRHGSDISISHNASKQTKKRIHNIAKFFLHQQNTNNSSLMQNFANCIKRDVFEVKNACHTREKTRNSSEETNVECL